MVKNFLKGFCSHQPKGSDAGAQRGQLWVSQFLSAISCWLIPVIPWWIWDVWGRQGYWTAQCWLCMQKRRGGSWSWAQLWFMRAEIRGAHAQAGGDPTTKDFPQEKNGINPSLRAAQVPVELCCKATPLGALWNIKILHIFTTSMCSDEEPQIRKSSVLETIWWKIQTPLS